MKNIIFTIISIIGYCAFSQTPVIDLFDHTGFRNVHEAYYKDTHNNFSPFLGTWMYQSEGTILTIKLKKIAQFYSMGRHIYMDYVVGEYKYVVNGVEVINTLSNFEQGVDNPYSYNLYGSIINTADNIPVCTSCAPFEKSLLLNFKDPSRAGILGLEGTLILRRLTFSGRNKLEVWLKQDGNIIHEEGATPAYTSFTVPWGTYVLTKVE